MPKRDTKKSFIEKARKVHGDKYDYSKVEYVNSTTKICIICPEHGEFMIRPSDHINAKCGCSKCTGLYKSDTYDFIRKAIGKYGNKYDYSKVDYVNNKTKVCIICHEKDEFGEEHGEFWQRPNDHLTGYECPKCKNEHVPTTEEWIKKAKHVHGNRYDYSKVEYVTSKTKVCITCPSHGDFFQLPNNHLSGSGCPACNSNAKSKMEEKVFEALSSFGVKVERQKTFDWLVYRRKMFLDFYLPEKNIGIEVQGDQHFQPIEKFGGYSDFELRMLRDDRKKLLCEEHGVKMFYVTKRNNGLETILDYLNETTYKQENSLRQEHENKKETRETATSEIRNLETRG